MTARRLVAAVVVAMAAVLIATGCTDDGDSAQPSGTLGKSATTTSTPPATIRDLAVTKENAADLPGFNIYRPTDLESTRAPLPVVVWANGGCIGTDAPWQPLLERWAGAGFFVVSIAEPPSSAEPAGLGSSSADDQARVIDWAFAQNDLSDTPYAGHLDVDRIVAAGNSCGGITSLNLAARDPRVRAVFVLSGSSVGPGASPERVAAVMGNVRVPVGYAVGGPEDIASSEAAKDFDALPDGVAGYVASRASGNHVVVSTDPAILAEVAEIGINWIDFALYGNQTAEAALMGAPCEACAPGLWTTKAKNFESLASA